MYTTLIEAELTFPVYIKSDSYKFIHFLDTPQSMYFQSINSVWTNSNKAYVINPVLLVREDFDMLEYQCFKETTLIEAELTFPVYIKSDSYKFI